MITFTSSKSIDQDSNSKTLKFMLMENYLGPLLELVIDLIWIRTVQY